MYERRVKPSPIVQPSSGKAVQLTEEGFDTCVKFLKELDERVNRKLLQRALVIAAKPLVRQARAIAPEWHKTTKEWWGEQRDVPPGTLKRSIGTILPKSKSDKFQSMFIGPKKTKPGRKRLKNDAWFRHMVIRGTAGYTIKKGPRRGQFMPGQEPNPFMDKAYMQVGGMVENELKNAVTTAVNQYCKSKGITVL